MSDLGYQKYRLRRSSIVDQLIIRVVGFLIPRCRELGMISVHTINRMIVDPFSEAAIRDDGMSHTDGS